MGKNWDYAHRNILNTLDQVEGCKELGQPGAFPDAKMYGEITQFLVKTMAHTIQVKGILGDFITVICTHIYVKMFLNKYTHIYFYFNDSISLSSESSQETLIQDLKQFPFLQDLLCLLFRIFTFQHFSPLYDGLE